jgi:hypothetical protein
VPIGTALFAATTAFQLVKEGCALYKEVKGVAGNVKQIYDEINGQFAGKKVSKAQAAEITKEKKRVDEVAKADPTEVMFTIGDNLGAMFDAFDTLEAIFWQQERDAKKVQTGSLKRLALKRILIRNKLQAMHAEIKHQMIYESPEELGSLWSDFEVMRGKIEAEQQTARQIQEHEDVRDAKRQEALMREVRNQAIDAGVAVAALLFLGWIMWQIKIQTAARASFWLT